ncbi:hypothetical protein [Secundilactobacillus collinoides]|uniref:hypothetical protein n=1 Tax=Secundilactobacillus collinoides TaxID=33960 RepID=UPI0006D120CB|nr:hypothetical protein [Secundilactobacillus collinoides]
MDQIWKWWAKLPKWIRDTIQVVMAMTILLIIYDLAVPPMTHKPYSMSTLISFPFQVILASLWWPFIITSKRVLKQKKKRQKNGRQKLNS